MCNDNDIIPACRWNGGGSFRGRAWSERSGLPTDAEIVAHCVAAYFDSRLPPARGVVDGRTFRYAQCSALGQIPLPSQKTY